ncbi:MAG: cytochrome c-type biogenesis protein CcmH [Burkholderiales bacterium]|nr:cytochrome c-type biogenesis protein CcmH [Burkholderiales bacterium]
MPSVIRSRMHRALFAVVLALTLGGAFGQEARPLADDPALEARVLGIAEHLRCLVCQNETIAASRADLANDLRDQIRAQLKEGRSEEQIKQYMVDRYGDFVLYTPPVRPTTWLLWAGPFVLLLAMLAWLAWLLRSRRHEAPAAPLGEAERARARALLGEAPEADPASPKPAKAGAPTADKTTAGQVSGRAR